LSVSVFNAYSVRSEWMDFAPEPICAARRVFSSPGSQASGGAIRRPSPRVQANVPRSSLCVFAGVQYCRRRFLPLDSLCAAQLPGGIRTRWKAVPLHGARERIVALSSMLGTLISMRSMS